MFAVAHRGRSLAPLSVVVSALALCPAPAIAEEKEGEREAEGLSAAQLEDIVVTAQRRAESLQSVPLTINALSGSSAEARGITNTDDLNIAVPSLNVSKTASASTIFLRGIGNNSNTAGQEQNVAFYVDEVYYTSMNADLASFNNIERLEVLKGPQGTLFGRNTTGGLIHIITRDPSHDMSGRFVAGYGNYDTVSGSAYITGGLSDTLAADLAVSGSHQGDGWGKNLFNGDEVNFRRDYSVRTKWLLTPDDATRITLSADFNYLHGDIGSSRQMLAGLPRLPASHGSIVSDGNIYNSNANLKSEDRIRNYGASLKVEREFAPFTVKSISALRRVHRRSTFDTDITPVAINGAIYDPETTATFSQEVQIVSPAGSGIDWITGLYYFHSNAGQHPLTIPNSALGAAQFLRLDDQLVTNSYSGFAQASIPLGPTTNLTIGGRYTRDEKRITGTVGNALGTTATIDRSKSWSNFTYRVGIDQQLAEDVLAYANVSSGFKSGLFDLVSPTRPPVNPEKLTAYEGGIKSRFLDRRVQLNVAGFYYDYKDIQVRSVLGGTAFLQNASKARVWGLEADGEVVISDALRLTGGLSYLNARYTSFRAAQIFPINPATGLGVATIADISGNSLPRAPRYTANAALAWSKATGIGKVGATLSYYYNGGFFWEPENALREDAYHIVNTELSWTSSDERYTARLWAKNLFDTQYYIYASSSNNTPASGAPGAPRTYGVSLGYAF